MTHTTATHIHQADPPSTHLIATPIKWAAEHDAMLKEMVEEKRHSYSEIAAALNGTFDTGYSRNAAIGRANRMGLDNSRADQNLRPSGRKPNRPKLRVVRAAGNSQNLRLAYSIERDLAPLRCAEIVLPRNLTLLELEPDDCRYPVNDGGPFLFCARPKLKGSSFCGPHHRLVWLPPTKRNERARGIR